MSSSVVVTPTVWLARPSQASSDAAALTETPTKETWSPSSTSSLTPVTATVWTTPQLVASNVSVVGEATAAVPSEAVTSNTTVPVGAVSSTTVNESEVPVSETTIGLPVTVKLGGVAGAPASRAQSGVYRATKPSEMPSDVNRV